MSEIQRYKLGGGSISEQDDGAYVLFTDHEAAIALRTRVCAEAFEDELARTEERVLADAKARIGRLAAPNGSYGEAEWGFLRGVTAALAALTQPQTEKCPVCDGSCCDDDGNAICDCLEGAATPRGVADADLERLKDRVASVVSPVADGGRDNDEEVPVRASALYSLAQALEAVNNPPVPSPYAKAFREKFPVPEFPGIKNRQEDQA